MPNQVRTKKHPLNLNLSEFEKQRGKANREGDALKNSRILKESKV